MKWEPPTIRTIDIAHAMPDLRRAILDAALVLDPERQGVQWPNPIAWDGRPLVDQAKDLLAIMTDAHEPERSALRDALADNEATAVYWSLKPADRLVWLAMGRELAKMNLR